MRPNRGWIARAVFAAGLLLAFTSAGAAGQVWGGPRLGVSLANVGGDDAPNAERRTGMVVGWSFSADRGERWGIQPEFHYWEKGAEARFFGLDTALKLSYLEVPVLFRLDLTGGGAISPHLLLGPTVAINLTCEGRVAAGPLRGRRDCDELQNFEARALEVGVGTGFGLSIDMGGWRLMGDLRYTLGLTDIFEDVEVRNRVFALTAGASFPLTR